MMVSKYNHKTYIYNKDTDSDQAVLLINLGSPLSYQHKDINDYLSEFLMDRNVIRMPYPFRFLLVKGIIVPFRTKYISPKYKTIWDEENKTFPLIKNSIDLAESISKLSSKVISIAMRYSNPSIKDALQGLKDLNKIKKLLVYPLYPHYTNSTFVTACEKVQKELRNIGWDDVEISYAKHFYKNEEYRKILAKSVLPYMDKHFDKLIVSYHGIPLSHLSEHCRKENGKTDYSIERHDEYCEDKDLCYRQNVEDSFRMLIEDLSIDKSKAELVYQSRLGKHQWLKPYIWERIESWNDEGVKDILIICPSFVTECLETTNEIDMYYKDIFLSKGGKSFTYIPCISAMDEFVKMIVNNIENGK